MLFVALAVQSLLIPLPRHCPARSCGAVCMVAATPAGFDVPTETVSDAPSEDPAPATEPTLEEQFLAMAAAPDGWADGSGLKAKLAELEKQYDSGQDPAAVKALLHGSWKLVSSTDASVSLTGSAPKSYTKTLGHVQSFRKPDPMDVFSGNKDKLFFMETTEVVANEKVGSSLTACIKGGFEVKPAGAVAEAYTTREVEGLSQEGPFASYNRWTCAYLSEAVRVCRLASGAVRVYEKVDATAAKAEVSRLASALVTIDPEAGADELVEEEEEYDDPNIPAWQKRIDKLDGTKRTKDGTPIINHGPGRFGPSTGGPP
mmetsp:Transcript_35486/g.60835  ORF Transcript_35486/g.60835 Transcript_35486/m.60835 type:complete len:316 (-) Transcript_35486:270-1217(-)